MKIRRAAEADAEQFIALTKAVDETGFMGYDPGERHIDLNDQRARINDSHAATYLAECDGQCVGFVAASFRSTNRMKTTARMFIGVLPAYHNRGIGHELMSTIEEWAKSKEIHRLELSTMIHNIAAIKLYLKRGFIIEGICKDDIKIGNQYVSNYMMAKLLD